MVSVRARAGLFATVLIAGVAIVAPSPAQAGAPGYNLSEIKTADGRTTIARYDPCRVITWKMNLDNVPRSARKSVQADTRKALQRLHAATGLTFSARGTTREVPRFDNLLSLSADLVIAYTTPKRTDMPIAGSSAGFGGFQTSSSWTVLDDGAHRTETAIVRGYGIFDTPDVLGLRPGFGPGANRGNLLLHELGHAVGLEHVNNPRQIMNPFLSSQSPNGYGAGDRKGLKRVGRPAGCVAAEISMPDNS